MLLQRLNELYSPVCHLHGGSGAKNQEFGIFVLCFYTPFDPLVVPHLKRGWCQSEKEVWVEKHGVGHRSTKSLPEHVQPNPSTPLQA